MPVWRPAADAPRLVFSGGVLPAPDAVPLKQSPDAARATAVLLHKLRDAAAGSVLLDEAAYGLDGQSIFEAPGSPNTVLPQQPLDGAEAQVELCRESVLGCTRLEALDQLIYIRRT
jgi:hypothetical protein